VNEVWQIDRSRVLDFLACPRKRWYGFHFDGVGIQRISKSLPLVFGDAFHQAAEIFLTGGDVEAAVARAVNFLNLTFSINGVDLESEKANVIAYGIEEQKAIVEGLIRGWCLTRRDDFLAQFEVIEVEQEGKASLSPTMELMFRPDALVREKLSGDLYVVSWKTASTFGPYTINQINTDMQSMSEVWGIQNTQLDYNSTDPKCDFGSGWRIEGVLYLFGVKGQRKMDDYLGFKVQNTPLAYGWVRKGNTEDEDEWAYTYSWTTEEMNTKTGKLMGTKLGKGFRKVPIWSDYPGGVKAWIEDLHAQRITPRHINPFEAIFPASQPVMRRPDEIESWKRQTISNEGRVQARVRAAELEPTVEILDREFPQSTARCYDYMSRCQFWECCFTPAVQADPLASGLYQIRTSNHPEYGDSE
jgi:hypothetical protein